MVFTDAVETADHLWPRWCIWTAAAGSYPARLREQIFVELRGLAPFFAGSLSASRLLSKLSGFETGALALLPSIECSGAALLGCLHYSSLCVRLLFGKTPETPVTTLFS
ncbi:hypothetical protein MRX96_050226 [Rhipicephalus microplus]